MKTNAVLLTIVANLSLVAFTQQNPPTVKGHKIGETLEEYLIVEKGSAESAARVLTDCAALITNPKQHRADPLPFEIQTHPCLEMAKILDGQPGDTSKSLVNATHPSETDEQEFHFEGKRLVRIQLYIHEVFTNVKHDLIEKYGPPDGEEEISYQNGFGAVFLHPRAAWIKRSDVVVLVSEATEAAAGIYPVLVTIADNSWAKSETEKKKNRPNSID